MLRSAGDGRIIRDGQHEPIASVVQSRHLETAGGICSDAGGARGSVVVVSGPHFFTNTSVRVIDENRVRVPDAFYKVIFLERESQRILGFILPYEGSSAPLCSFAASVDAVEEATGLDFSALPDDIETVLGAQVGDAGG